MNGLVMFATIMFVIQTAHSIEELTAGFHKKWYLFKMPFRVFLAFEIIFETFWLFVLLLENFPYRIQLLTFFIFLMLANGIQHIVWAGAVKRYVPGLITSPLFLIVFLIYYFQMVAK